MKLPITIEELDGDIQIKTHLSNKGFFIVVGGVGIYNGRYIHNDGKDYSSCGSGGWHKTVRDCYTSIDLYNSNKDSQVLDLSALGVKVGDSYGVVTEWDVSYHYSIECGKCGDTIEYESYHRMTDREVIDKASGDNWGLLIAPKQDPVILCDICSERHCE